MDFNVIEYEKFIDMVSDSILQLKKLSVKFYTSIKEKYLQLSEKAIIMFLFHSVYSL